jgi:hypothetical protein
VTLTAEHKLVLNTVGTSGGSWLSLVRMARLDDLFSLEAAGFLWRESCETMQIWHLTERGAVATGINPARIFQA